jgi:hypothetical protein
MVHAGQKKSEAEENRNGFKPQPEKQETKKHSLGSRRQKSTGTERFLCPGRGKSTGPHGCAAVNSRGIRMIRARGFCRLIPRFA